jgi:hypothetical protein
MRGGCTCVLGLLIVSFREDYVVVKRADWRGHVHILAGMGVSPLDLAGWKYHLP